MSENNWTPTPLGEILEIKYGKDHKHLADGEFPVFGSGGIMRYAEKPLYDKPSILIPRKGTLSNLFYVDKPFWSVDTMFYTKINEQNNSKYIYYFLKSIDLAALNVGSAVPSLTTEVLNNVEIKLPNRKTQDKIASILSSLDDKIELNNQMNQTLEQIAQAIFKEWFVDFNFPGFDGNLVDGVPKGWRKGKLGELVKVISKGTTPTQNDIEGLITNIPFIKVKDISENGTLNFSSLELIPEEIHLGKLKRSILLKDDILFSIAGTIGRVATVPQQLDNSNCNQAVAFIRLLDKSTFLEYIYLLLSTDDVQSKIKSNIVQGVQANVSLTVLNNIEINIPTDNLMIQWKKIIEPIFKKFNNNLDENQTLEEIKQKLLPKLLSDK